MRTVRGIEVTDDTLSLDVIADVCGPDGAGHYLGTAQSLELMTTEYYYPHLADRRSREDWEADGSRDLRERARDRARELLETHRVTPFPDGVDDALRDRFDLRLPTDLAAG
jgi:trimethylamine---corrinoid protein Co-methyltransferase